VLTLRADQHRSRIAASAGLALALSVPLILAAPAGAGAEPAGSTAASTAALGADIARVRCKVSVKLVPNKCGAWMGVAPTPHKTETYDTALGKFENRIDRTVDIVHYYMSGQALKFPTTSMLERANEPGKERLLMINWKPDLTWRAVADGEADAYLVELAQHIQTYYPDPFFLSLHAEPERVVDQTKGSGMTAKNYVAFYRHTVDVLRANGADQIVLMMNYVGIPKWGVTPWFETLYPGDAYVDWIAQDPFAFGDEPGIWLSDFAGMVDRQDPELEDWPGFYTWATTEHPGKPMMLAEWGVSEEPKYPDYKPDFFAHTLDQLKDFPKIKGLVYWDHPGGTLVGETRVNSSRASLREFTRMAGSRTLTKPGEFYLDRPAGPQ